MSQSRSAVIAAVLVMLVAGTPAPASAEPAQREWRVTTVAGMGEAGYSGDGGPATEARLGASAAYGPRLAVARDGTIYLAEWANHRLRRITPDGVIDTVPGTVTRIGNPRGVAIAGDGTVYLATELGISRIGGTALPLPESAALISDVTVDPAGNLYYSNHFFDDADQRKATVVRVDPAGATTTIVEGDTDIYAIAVDATGTVYYTTGGLSADTSTVHVVGADGAPRAAVTLPDEHIAGPLALAPDGTPHVVDLSGGQILRIGAQGDLTPVGPSLPGQIEDLAFGADGAPYVVAGATVRRIDRFTGDEKEPRQAASPWADDAPGSVHRVAGNGTEPGSAATGLSTPAVGKDGTVYVAEPRRNQVHAISRDGEVTRFAGTGVLPDKDYSPEGRTADKVELAAPHAVAADESGTVYVATRTGILKIAQDRRVSKVDTGTAVDNTLSHTDHPDRMPQLAVDGTGTLFYAQTTGPLEGVVRTVTADGEPTTVAGTDPGTDGLLPGPYSDGKPATDGTLRLPTAISVAGDGTVYVIEGTSESSVHAVRAVRPDGVLVTVTGNADDDLPGNGAFAGDGGPATKAAVNSPRGVAAAPDGGFYVADTYNARIRRVTADGVITTIAGTGRSAETGDGGPAAKAALLDPAGVAVGADGTVYVTSAASTRVRAIAPDGTITTLADLRTPPAENPLKGIDKLAAGPDGTMYVGSPGDLAAFGPDGPVDVLGLAMQGPVATGPDGSVYELVPVHGAEPRAQLWRRYPDGTMLRVAADEPMSEVRDVAVGPAGEIYLATESNVTRLGDERPLLSAEYTIGEFTVGADGTLYVVKENQVFALRKGKPELVAGNGNAFSSDEAEENEDGGPARDASLAGPTAVAATGDGTVYIATEEGLRRVRGGVIETLDAGVAEPVQLAITPAGDLYVAGADQVVVVVRPAEVEVDRTSWTWVWFVLGALALLGAGTVVFLRRRPRARTEDEAAVSPDPDEVA